MGWNRRNDPSTEYLRGKLSCLSNKGFGYVNIPIRLYSWEKVLRNFLDFADIREDIADFDFLFIEEFINYMGVTKHVTYPCVNSKRGMVQTLE